MKETGVVRDLDQLGRIVLPREYRRTLNINPKDYLEIYVEDDTIILQKYANKCELCGSADDIVRFNGKGICMKCINNIVKNYSDTKAD